MADTRSIPSPKRTVSKRRACHRSRPKQIVTACANSARAGRSDLATKADLAQLGYDLTWRLLGGGGLIAALAVIALRPLPAAA